MSSVSIKKLLSFGNVSHRTNYNELFLTRVGRGLTHGEVFQPSSGYSNV